MKRRQLNISDIARVSAKRRLVMNDKCFYTQGKSIVIIKASNSIQ